jgi:hypothetical protein
MLLDMIGDRGGRGLTLRLAEAAERLGSELMISDAKP